MKPLDTVQAQMDRGMAYPEAESKELGSVLLLLECHHARQTIQHSHMYNALNGGSCTAVVTLTRVIGPIGYSYIQAVNTFGKWLEQ